MCTESGPLTVLPGPHLHEPEALHGLSLNISNTAGSANLASIDSVRVERIGGAPLTAPLAPGSLCAANGGFRHQARVCIAADGRDGIERLLRYISRPPIAIKRLSLAHAGISSKRRGASALSVPPGHARKAGATRATSRAPEATARARALARARAGERQGWSRSGGRGRCRRGRGPRGWPTRRPGGGRWGSEARTDAQSPGPGRGER
ncbi:MAG TPA: hypothetical protein ENJ09_05875 [Planctomycetes bacterium]|nr:hypothetical protein [Planctomycetota bacterium]